jgi:hypothetical protein
MTDPTPKRTANAIAEMSTTLLERDVMVSSYRDPSLGLGTQTSNSKKRILLSSEIAEWREMSDVASSPASSTWARKPELRSKRCVEDWRLALFGLSPAHHGFGGIRPRDQARLDGKANASFACTGLASSLDQDPRAGLATCPNGGPESNECAFLSR